MATPLLQRLFSLSCGIAVAYAVLGRLSLLLAIPPGFATAVFPPAGLALFCLIRFGPTALPGIWLGSVLMNLSTTWLAQGWPSPIAWLMTAMIGCGAAGQAYAGYWLMRRHTDLPLAWHDEHVLMRFAWLAGSVSTLIGASTGIGSLWLGGQISSNEAAYNWLTWWVGDSIGVLLVTPLLLLASSEPGSDDRQLLRSVSIPIAITFSLVTLLFIRASGWEQKQIHDQFLEQAGRIERQLQRAFQQHIDTLDQLERFFAASGDPSPADFAEFTSTTINKFNGKVSLSWVHHVTENDRHQYELGMRQRLGPSFEIWHRDSTGQRKTMPAGIDYFPISYIEPIGSAWLAGFDNGSGPTRRELMEAALRRREATVSPRLWLGQLEQNVAAILLARPVLRRGQEHADSLVVAGIEIAATVTYGLQGQMDSGIAVELLDLNETGERRTLFSNLPPKLQPDPAFSHRLEWNFGGRRWQILLHAMPAYLRETHAWQGWFVMVAGMLFTGLLGAMLLLVNGRALRVQRLVEQRTAELARQQQTLQTISDSAADSILLLDEQGRIHMANPAAEALLQQPSILLHGKPLSAWLPEWKESWLLEATHLGQSGLRRDTQLQIHNQSPREVELALTALQKTGQRRYCCLLHDMTERIAHERIKREFVAMVSHELRTPLTSIRGALALLNSGQVNQDAAQYQQLLKIATDNSRRLLLLVNDLLDFEKLEIGKFELELHPVAVGPLLQQAIDELQGVALSNGLTIELQNQLPANAMLMLAPDRFVQIVFNLLSNAIKFSDKSRVVQLCARQEGEEACIEVTDQGIGIAADKQAFIFEKFWQADASTSRKHSGTGLGLAICKGLTEAMAGRIGFHSTLGRGSTFWLRFPLVRESE
ncbi:MAG TPA: ATP-binding protein [Permianibacter sp.]|nr:ATP-binding protein [Permianibacter sp.]